MSNAIELDEENFDSAVLPGSGLVLADFWAGWCGPCVMLAPVIEELADELDGTVAVGKINVEESPALAARFGVVTIPTVILFRDGAEAARCAGALSKEDLLDLIRGV